MASGGEGAKAFGGIAILLALVAAMAAIMRPMHFQITSVQDEMHTLRNDLTRHTEKKDHPAWQTQEIVDLKVISDRIRQWQESHDLRVVALNAAQWERIKALERQLYGQEVSLDP